MRAYGQGFIRFRRSYQNYFHVIISTLRRKYPIQAVLRNGHRAILKDQTQGFIMSLLETQKSVKYDQNTDIVLISNAGVGPAPVKLEGVTSNYDIHLFTEGWMHHYAESIIALEPILSNFKMAWRNIETNRVSSSIKLLLAGISSRLGYMTIDPEHSRGTTGKLIPSNGEDIPVFTLEDVPNNNNITSQHIILKMDCEGCEY